MSDTLTALQHLDPPTVTVTVLAAVAAASAVVDPVLGRRQHRRLLADLGTADGSDARDGVRRRLYTRWTAHGWVAALVVVGLVVALPGVSARDLGLTLAWSGQVGGVDLPVSPETLAGLLVGLAVGTLVVAGVLALVRRRTPGGRLPMAGAAAVTPMLPETPAGRRGWAGLAVTAGVTEEITHRGLLLLVVATLLPDAPRTVVVLAAALVFALAHWYQGPVGMLATGAVGWTLAQVYLSTGSLLLPMLVHVLVDLRPLLVDVVSRRRTTLVPA